jgi:integrase
MARHEILGGIVQLYKRSGGRFWQCSASIKGRQFRNTTDEEELSLAKEIAEDWYLGLRGKIKTGEINLDKPLRKKNEKTFREVAEVFEAEYPVMTEGQRSPKWVQGHRDRLRLHLLPFFGDLGISEVTTSKVQQYRLARADVSGKKPILKKNGKLAKRQPRTPAQKTLHNEIGTLSLVLQTADRHHWLTNIPKLSAPYRGQGKVSHRAWFSPEEYKKLYEATRAYAAKPALAHFSWNAEQVHDFVLFMANTGLRPDEVKNLEHRDVSIIEDEETDETILLIEVRGKRGVGYCKSMPTAVLPYERLFKRPLPGLAQGRRARIRRGEDPKTPSAPAKIKLPAPTDKVFPGNHIKLFNRLLDKNNLKTDRQGKLRTAYSLRHTYISMRLMQGADIYALAKNCRTSVEMIEKHYAAHIKDAIVAADVNRQRPKQRPKKNSKSKADFESAAGRSEPGPNGP